MISLYLSRAKWSRVTRLIPLVTRLSHNLSSQSREIQRAEHLQRFLNITWNGGEINQYPLVYLRENCRCPVCFHESSRQRAMDPVGEIDVMTEAGEVDMDKANGTVSITWPDGHVSEFDSHWLFERRFPQSHDGDWESGRESLAPRDVDVFGCELTGKIPTFSFLDALGRDEAAEFGWLNNMSRVGVALLTDVPTQSGQIEKLADHLGFLKESPFG